MSRSFLKRHVLALCVTAVAIAAFAAYLGAHQEMGYLDETQHFDYLERASNGQLLRRGATIGPEAMRELACRGIDIDRDEYERFYGQPKDLPPCGESNMDPTRFPERGINQTAIHPPVYYVVTGLTARAIRAATPIGSLLTAGRVANVIWLLLALAFMWAILAELSIPDGIRALVVALMLTAPPLVQTLGTVTPDAASLASGGAVLLAALRWERRRWPSWALPAAAFTVVWIKETDAIAVAMVLIFLLFRINRNGVRRTLTQIGIVLAAVAVAAGAWLALEASIATIPTREVPLIARFQTQSLNADDLIGQIDSVVTPVHNWLPPQFLRNTATALSGTLLDFLLLGGAVAAATAGSRGDRVAGLGGSELVAMFIAGPAFVAANFLLLGIFIVIPQRHALALVPGLIATAGFAAERRWVRVTIAVVGVLGVVALLQGVAS